MHRPQLWNRRAETAIAIAGFAGARAYAWAAGVRFDDSSLDYYWQYIDPALLRAHPLESLVHLHAQPPLFNSGLALVLQLPAAWQRVVFHLGFAACGLALALCLLLLLRQLGVPVAARLGIVLAIAASPAALLYENFLFYPYPVAAALVVAAWCLHRHAGHGGLASGLGAALALTVPALTQSLFHILWLATVVAVAVALLPDRRRAAILVLPLVFSAVWSARTALLFGVLGGSSWAGMNLARVVTRALPDESLLAFGAHPETAILATRPFSTLAELREFRTPHPSTGVALLDEEIKSTGAPNFHHFDYIAISRGYGRAVRWLLVREPELYLRGVANAVGIYFRAAADSAWLGRNGERLVGWSGLWNRWIAAQPRPFDGRVGLGAVAWLAVAAWVVGLGWGTARLCGPRRLRETDPARRLLLAFAVLTVGWVTLAGCLLELGENNRFRFEVAPLVALLLADLTARAAGRRSG